MSALAEFEALTQVDELRRINRDLEARLKSAKAKTDDLVAATIKGAHDAMTAFGPVRSVPAPPKDRRKGKPEVALWHLTDWQGSKVTTSYDSYVMASRIMRFCDKAEEITSIFRAHHPVRECYVLLGGDLIEGLFNFPQQPFEVDSSIFGQYVSASRLLVDVLRRALAFYDSVTVVCEWGNHGRVGAKRAAVPRSDNFDRMVYELAKGILSGERRLRWVGGDEDMQRVEIGNYRALLIHGDEIGRNGYASPSTIVHHVTRWQSGSYPWAFTDCYMGHYHSHAQWPLPSGTGSVYQTGSPESDNRYARDTMAAQSRPSQRLHFVDPHKGRVTYACQVWLDD